VTEELLGSGGVDVGDGCPLSLLIPNPSRSEAMRMRMGTDGVTKCLWYRHNAGTSPRVADGFSHQLLDGFITEPSHVGQELSVMHKIRP
jgi:hypothetical protein